MGNSAPSLGNIHIKSDGGFVVVAPSVGQDGGKYETIIGFDDVPIAPIPEAWREEVQKQNPINNPVYFPSEEDPFSEGQRDNNLYNLACTLLYHGYSDKYVIDVVRRIASTANFPEREALRKVESAKQSMKRWKTMGTHYTAITRQRGESTPGGEDLEKSIREWISNGVGTFSTNQLKRDLSIQESSLVVIAILNKLHNEGLIEPDYVRQGFWRIPNREKKFINILDDTDVQLDINFPLEEETLIIPMATDVFMVAGEPDIGKTAYCINFAGKNVAKENPFTGKPFPVTYFCSEMSSTFKERLKHTGRPLTWWQQHVTFVERRRDFSDVIDQNGINIIDYLKLDDNFFQIDAYTSAIQEKLKTGIALIAIQKNRMRIDNKGNIISGQLGVGGDKGLQTPRLYVTLSRIQNRNAAFIEKGKNLKNPKVRAGGKKCYFKLVNGCEFLPVNEWMDDLPAIL